MSKIISQEQLEERASDLTTHNGMERVFVTLEAAAPPTFAWLKVEFYNAVALADIVNDITTTALTSSDVFQIAGGSRILGDAAPEGVIEVTEVQPVAGENSLQLKVEPIGDYSTYQVNFIANAYPLDPLFASVDFKFRPGCFNTNCAPLSNYLAANSEPVIDYLAKDFHSFKHLLLNSMRESRPRKSI